MATYNGADKRLAYLFENGGGGGGGTTVVANPAGDATDMLKKLQVGSDIYSVLNEGGLAVTYHANWTATASSASGTKLTQELTIPKGKYIAVAQHAPSLNATSLAIFSLSIDDVLNVKDISNTAISYGTATFCFELSKTCRVAYAAATSTAMTWDSAYIDRGGMDIIALPDVVYLPEIYSTQERQIGVWTDGKPIYERVYDFNSINLQPNPWYDTGIDSSNIDTLVDGIAYNKTWTLTCVCVFKNGAKINVVNLGNSALSTNRIILKYTKTTDVAGSGIYTPSGALSERYSTDEQIIGTWIDGSTLYRRSYVLSANTGGFAQNTWKEIPDIDSSNMRGVIKCSLLYFDPATPNATVNYDLMASTNGAVFHNHLGVLHLRPITLDILAGNIITIDYLKISS